MAQPRLASNSQLSQPPTPPGLPFYMNQISNGGPVSVQGETILTKDLTTSIYRQSGLRAARSSTRDEDNELLSEIDLRIQEGFAEQKGLIEASTKVLSDQGDRHNDALSV